MHLSDLYNIRSKIPTYDIPIHHDLPSHTPEPDAHQQKTILRSQTRYYSRTLLNRINPGSFHVNETPSLSHKHGDGEMASPTTLPPLNYDKFINDHPLTPILTGVAPGSSSQQRHPKLHQDRLPEHILYSPIPEGLTVYPTLEEFADPNEYIRSLTKHGCNHGIIRIVPPPGFHCDFQLDADTYTFRSTKQIIGRFGKGGCSIPGREWTLSSYIDAAQKIEQEFYLKENARLTQKVAQNVVSSGPQVITHPPSSSPSPSLPDLPSSLGGEGRRPNITQQDQHQHQQQDMGVDTMTRMDNASPVSQQPIPAIVNPFTLSSDHIVVETPSAPTLPLSFGSKGSIHPLLSQFKSVSSSDHPTGLPLHLVPTALPPAPGNTLVASPGNHDNRCNNISNTTATRPPTQHTHTPPTQHHLPHSPRVGSSPDTSCFPSSISMSDYPSPPPRDIHLLKRSLNKQDILLRDHNLRLLVNQKQHFFAARQYNRERQLFGISHQQQLQQDYSQTQRQRQAPSGHRQRVVLASRRHPQQNPSSQPPIKRMVKKRGRRGNHRQRPNPPHRHHIIAHSSSTTIKRMITSQLRQLHRYLFGQSSDHLYAHRLKASSSQRAPQPPPPRSAKPTSTAVPPRLGRDELLTQHPDEELLDISPYLNINHTERRHPILKSITDQMNTKMRKSPSPTDTPAVARRMSTKSSTLAHDNDMADEDIINQFHLAQQKHSLWPIAKRKRRIAQRAYLSEYFPHRHYQSQLHLLSALPPDRLIPIYAQSAIRLPYVRHLRYHRQRSSSSTHHTRHHLPPPTDHVPTTEFHDVMSFIPTISNISSENHVAHGDIITGRKPPQQVVQQNTRMNVVPVAITTTPYETDHEQFLLSFWIREQHRIAHRILRMASSRSISPRDTGSLARLHKSALRTRNRLWQQQQQQQHRSRLSSAKTKTSQYTAMGKVPPRRRRRRPRITVRMPQRHDHSHDHQPSGRDLGVITHPHNTTMSNDILTPQQVYWGRRVVLLGHLIYRLQLIDRKEERKQRDQRKQRGQSDPSTPHTRRPTPTPCSLHGLVQSDNPTAFNSHTLVRLDMQHPSLQSRTYLTTREHSDGGSHHGGGHDDVITHHHHHNNNNNTRDQCTHTNSEHPELGSAHTPLPPSHTTAATTTMCDLESIVAPSEMSMSSTPSSPPTNDERSPSPPSTPQTTTAESKSQAPVITTNTTTPTPTPLLQYAVLSPQLVSIACLALHTQRALLAHRRGGFPPALPSPPGTHHHTPRAPTQYQHLLHVVLQLSQQHSASSNVIADSTGSRDSSSPTQQHSSLQPWYQTIPLIACPFTLYLIYIYFHRVFPYSKIAKRMKRIEKKLQPTVHSARFIFAVSGIPSAMVLVPRKDTDLPTPELSSDQSQSPDDQSPALATPQPSADPPTPSPSNPHPTTMSMDNGPPSPPDDTIRQVSTSNTDHDDGGDGDSDDNDDNDDNDNDDDDDDMTVVRGITTITSLDKHDVLRYLNLDTPMVPPRADSQPSSFHAMDGEPRVVSTRRDVTVAEFNPTYAQPFPHYYTDRTSLLQAIRRLTTAIQQNIHAIPSNLNEVMNHITMTLIELNLIEIPHPHTSPVVSLYFPHQGTNNPYGLPSSVWTRRYLSAGEQCRIQLIEDYYWSALVKHTHHIDIEYAKDLNTRRHAAYPHPYWTQHYPYKYHQGRWSPSTNTQRVGRSTSLQNCPLPPLRDPWNPHILPFINGSLLPHIGLISGISNPWLYIAGLFSSFPWHIEDDYFYSLSTNVTNSPKVWYGIANADADLFEALFARCIDHGLTSIHSLSNIVSPQLLMAYGIKVTKLIQHPGEFILTLPRGYHSGFSLGLSIAEAVNLAIDTWTPHGRLASIKYRYENNRESVVAIEYLIMMSILEFTNDVVNTEIQLKASTPGVSWDSPLHQPFSFLSLSQQQFGDALALIQTHRGGMDVVPVSDDATDRSSNKNRGLPPSLLGAVQLPPDNHPPASTGVIDLPSSLTSMLTNLYDQRRKLLSEDLFTTVSDMIQDEIDVITCITGGVFTTPLQPFSPLKLSYYSMNAGDVYRQYYTYLSYIHPDIPPRAMNSSHPLHNTQLELKLHPCQQKAIQYITRYQQQRVQSITQLFHPPLSLTQQSHLTIPYQPQIVYWNDCDIMLLFNIAHRKYDDLFIPTCRECSQYCFTSFTTCYSLYILFIMYPTIEKIVELYTEIRSTRPASGSPAVGTDSSSDTLTQQQQQQQQQQQNHKAEVDEQYITNTVLPKLLKLSTFLQPLYFIIRSSYGFCAYTHGDDIYHAINAQTRVDEPIVESAGDSHATNHQLVNDTYFIQHPPSKSTIDANNAHFTHICSSKDGVFACQYHAQHALCVCSLFFNDRDINDIASHNQRQRPCSMPIQFRRFNPILLKQFQSQNFPHFS